MEIIIRNRVAQWKRTGLITQRSVVRIHALLFSMDLQKYDDFRDHALSIKEKLCFSLKLKRRVGVIVCNICEIAKVDLEKRHHDDR